MVIKQTSTAKIETKNGGGVFITIHDRFTTNAVESGDNKCELAWAEVQTNAKSVIIGSFYRPPNSNPEALQELRTSIEKIKQKSKTKPIILAGDFNLPHIDWDNNTVKPRANLIYQHQELLDIKDEFNLEQLQLNPSRENNNLDLFFTDHPSLIKSCDTSPGISDHHAIVIDSNLKPSYNKPKRRNIYLFKKANWENIKEEIAKIGSTIINSTKYLEEKWTDLKDGINNALNTNVPSKQTSRRHNLPWLTLKDKRLIKKKNRLFQHAKQTSKEEDWAKYRKHKRVTQKDNHIANM
jgi:hypothetical protein